MADIQGIFYAEFDNHVGPTIRSIYPNDILTKEYSEILSEYIILEKHLNEEVISLNYDKLCCMFICTNLNDKKYERNTLSFSIGFLLSPNVNNSLNQSGSSHLIVPTVAYSRVLRQIFFFFRDLEVSFARIIVCN